VDEVAVVITQVSPLVATACCGLARAPGLTGRRANPGDYHRRRCTDSAPSASRLLRQVRAFRAAYGLLRIAIQAGPVRTRDMAEDEHLSDYERARALMYASVTVLELAVSYRVPDEATRRFQPGLCAVQNCSEPRQVGIAWRIYSSRRIAESRTCQVRIA
jgi:hypothetical protein